MFCRNCGKQLPDGVRFCTGCGTRVDGGGAAAPSSQPAAKPKKKQNWGRALIFGVAAALFTSLMAYAAENSKPKFPDVEDDGITSASYMEVFSRNGYIFPITEFVMENAAAYAKDLGNGAVDHMEFAYKDGIVTAVCEKLYVSVGGLDEATKALLHESTMSPLHAADALDNCSVTYDLGPYQYVYTIKVTELDNQEKLKNAVRTGAITLEGEIDGRTYMTIKETENNLLAQGYIKR